MGQIKRYSPEVRERAVRLVAEQRSKHGSQWATLVSIASKIGCTPETLRSWVQRSERESQGEDSLSVSERDQLKKLQRENRELKEANEILRKASAFFAQAELDRKRK